MTGWRRGMPGTGPLWKILDHGKLQILALLESPICWKGG
jgi:hypothetical protein